MQTTYLIKLRNNASKEDFKDVTSVLKKNMAQIIFASPEKYWIIANLDQKLADMIRKKPIVEGIGGLSFKKRDVKVIRTLQQTPIYETHRNVNK